MLTRPSLRVWIPAACVALGAVVALWGYSSLLWLVLGAAALAVLDGGAFMPGGLLVWLALLPSQFVPVLRVSVLGLTLDPTKVLILAAFARQLLVIAAGRERAGVRPRLAGVIVAFTAVVIGSSVLGEARGESLQWTAHWLLSGGCLALTLYLWARRRGPDAWRSLALNVVAVLSAVSAYALVESFVGANPVIEAWLALVERGGKGYVIARSAAGAIPYKPHAVPYRSLATIGHPVFAAVFLVPAVPLAAGLTAVSKGAVRKLCLLAVPLTLAGVTATGTRGSMLAALVGLGLVTMSPAAARLSGGRRALALAFVSMLLIVGLMVSGALPAPAAIQRATASGAQLSESFVHRTMTGTAALRVAAASPLTGVGAGAFRRMYATVVAANDPVSSIEDPARFSVDDTYLLAAAEFGVAGVILLVAMLWRLRRDVADDTAVPPRLRLAWQGALLGMAVSYLFADALYVAPSVAVLWMMTGAALVPRESA